MNCGDMVYRSTLDPTLRMEQRGINPQGIALLAISLSYLLSKPGVLQGWLDTYIAAPLQRAQATPYTREDFKIGKKLATGGFGTVYKAEIISTGEPVVVKKATEFGEAEVWMNERMARAAPESSARFITAFSEANAKEGDPLWLAWAYEGDSTLAQLMVAKNFPDNLEAMLFERPLKIPKGADRRAVVLRLAIRQMLEALKSCHTVGIVHRDVKPQNSIVSASERRVKLIDFGAAADLRVGINYVPNQYLLDPRYAPPEQYVMSSQTPKAPPAPVAAFLSPVLWQLNGPDRFDMFSVGITLLQLALPPLRNDNNLIAFNYALKTQYKWDLEKWRTAMEKKGGKEWAEGFATLDALGGGGWDLVKQLVQCEPSARLPAPAALTHRWFDPSPLEAMTVSAVEGLGRAASSLVDVDDGWLEKQIVRSGSRDSGGFTEMQLRDELGMKTVGGGGGGSGGGGGGGGKRGEVPQASATIAWWKGRQSDVEAKLKERRVNGNGFVVPGFLVKKAPAGGGASTTPPPVVAVGGGKAKKAAAAGGGGGGSKGKGGGLIGFVGLKKPEKGK